MKILWRENTPNSDMYSLGKLMETELSSFVSGAEAQDFIRKVKSKEVTAAAALNHEWLKGLGIVEF